MAKTIESISIGIKLDGSNFPVWSRLMRIAIGGRELLDHLEPEAEPPNSTDPSFKAWQAADYIVFSWLIQNMEPRLVLQFAQHQTAAAMWRSLATTFGARKDPVQVYDLENRTNKLVQGNDSLEAYWAELQNLWVGMDNRKPCPYSCCDDAVKTYRRETEIKRLFQFLSGLNERFDGIRRELLKEVPEPSPETAFGIVKQEEGRGGIWKPQSNPDGGIGSGFGIRPNRYPPHQQQARTNQGGPPPAPPHRGQPPPRGNPGSKNREDKSKQYCTHCRMYKHTIDTCFQIHGYPEWWEDGHKFNRSQPAKGRSAVGIEGEGRSSTGGENLGVADGRSVEMPAGGWWAANQTTNGTGNQRRRRKPM